MALSISVKKTAVLVTSVLIGLSTISGCATTSYGQSFAPDGQVANQFKVKIYLSAFSSADAADKNAKAEMDKFAAEKKLGAGTIVNRRYNVFPEYYEYTVKFAAR
jgi:hypothetical protein